jgi:hypothetical protein
MHDDIVKTKIAAVKSAVMEAAFVIELYFMFLDLNPLSLTI